MDKIPLTLSKSAVLDFERADDRVTLVVLTLGKVDLDRKRFIFVLKKFQHQKLKIHHEKLNFLTNQRVWWLSMASRINNMLIKFRFMADLGKFFLIKTFECFCNLKILAGNCLKSKSTLRKTFWNYLIKWLYFGDFYRRFGLIWITFTTLNKNLWLVTTENTTSIIILNFLIETTF